MFPRCLKIPQSKSFFLFGARGTGKSTLLRTLFSGNEALTFDLLLPEVEERFARKPESLLHEVRALPPEVTTIILDEVQKVPKLLDIVHHALELPKNRMRFVMTGSSGRRLRRGGANLLAGRAFVRDIFPLVVSELGDSLDVATALEWGTLPYIFHLANAEERTDFLASYVRTYVSEEIQREQVVRNLDPFRRFIEVAAQHNGCVINYANIARGIGVDPKTVASYYAILEDTLLGHIVPPYAASFRKRLTRSPKFYFFDTGVCRAIARTTRARVSPGTSYYGELFEQFVAVQLLHGAAYVNPNLRIMFYLDENGVEADLVVECPGFPLRFIEIKSASAVHEGMVKNLRTIRKDFPEAIFQIWSQDPVRKVLGEVTACFWAEGLRETLEG